MLERCSKDLPVVRSYTKKQIAVSKTIQFGLSGASSSSCRPCLPLPSASLSSLACRKRRPVAWSRPVARAQIHLHASHGRSRVQGVILICRIDFHCHPLALKYAYASRLRGIPRQSHKRNTDFSSFLCCHPDQLCRPERRTRQHHRLANEVSACECLRPLRSRPPSNKLVPSL